MKLLKIKISQESLSGTEFKGDTFFGHLFLAIKYIYGDKIIDEVANLYEENPIFIVSDLFPEGKIPKPLYFSENKKDLENKNLKKLKWISYGSTAIKDIDKEIEFMSISSETKNNTEDIDEETKEKKTTPYTLPYYKYHNGEFFVLINQELLSKFNICFEKLLDFISLNGYGKKSNLGKGIFKFEISDFSFQKGDYYMTSSLCNAENSLFKKYEMKKKEGFKHYGEKKKPILLKTIGSVLKKDNYNKPYIGKAIYNKKEKYIEQGFSILIPFSI